MQQILEIIKTFKDEGNVKIENIFSDDEKVKLKKECLKMLEKKPYAELSDLPKYDYQYDVPVLQARDRLVLENIIGISPEVDKIMEKFFSNKIIKELFNDVIGQGYKLWSCGIRLSLANSKQLGFHNDAVGEMGISILLEDQFDSEGVTCLIPKSHLWPYSSQETKIDTLPIWFFKFLYKPLVGKLGDTFIFFKKTAHGRLPNNTAKSTLILLIALYSPGYKFRRFKIGENIIKKIGPELTRLMSTDNLEKINSKYENEYLILKNDNNAVNYVDTLYKNQIGFFSPWRLVKLMGIIIIYLIKFKKILKFK